MSSPNITLSIPTWSATKAYKQNQPVVSTGLIYTAIDDHVSGATFAADKTAHWTQVGTVLKVDGVVVNSLDIDSTPATPASIGAVPTSLVTAKGDLIVATASNTVTNKVVGTDGQVLTADAASTGGIKWSTPNSGTFARATDADPYYAPQWPRFVGPAEPYANNSQLAMSTNTLKACRVVIPRTGFLRDVTVWVQTQSGNMIAGIYDLGDTTSTVRTKKWDSGTVAVGAQGYQTIGDPNMAVTQGQMLDLAVIADNATVSLGCLISYSTSARANLPSAFLPTPGGCLPKLGWANAPGSFILPTTVSEGSAFQNIQPIYIFARIS